MRPPPAVQFLEPVGGTVRIAAVATTRMPRVIGVLVVEPGLPCNYWLSILPLAQDPALGYFIRTTDLQVITDHLYVRPTEVPAFMVAVNGYFVDVFPAPLPPSDHPVDPLTLIQLVRERLDRYASTV